MSHALRLTFSILVPSTERLDRFLADQLALSRTQTARLVAEGRVLVEGAAARASRLLARHEVVEVDLPDEEPLRAIVPHDLALTVVYEDEHLLVIDKPAGLVAGGAAGNLIDRVRSPQGVVDFLDVGLSTMRWPTFNVADIGVTCGAIALAVSFWLEDARRSRATSSSSP